VKEYYERNTNRFLRFGGGGKVGAIHRKLWGPGVQTDEEALLYINKWIVDKIKNGKPGNGSQAHHIDLGCGVGGSVLFVAKSTGAKVHGITLSPKQAQIGVNRANELELQDKCSFIIADYQAIPVNQEYDAAFAIESFVHSDNAQLFFEQISKRLRLGGQLLLVDDMLTKRASSRAANGDPAAWLERFKTGWRINSLMKPGRIRNLAQKTGLSFKSISNFSAYIEKSNKFTRLIIKFIARIPLRGVFWQSISGGIALQVCISNGWVQYQGLVFEKA
jgi:ubiquinone/menaquinone biosynthesis C-methylase UbiE